MKPNTPTLESLSSIHADGSKKSLHPADVHGPFTRWRRLAALVMLTIYVALPWIPVNGYPAVFLDVVERRFHFFGITFATQDLWIGFFVVTGLAFSLFYITALFGRLWCGWTCPYTVFLENVYRRIERLIDGDATARRALDAAPWTGMKITKRVTKHALYLLVSALIAHVALSYFVSLHGLYEMMSGPPQKHLVAFGVVLFLTAALYGSFSWFREQFCVILCPYGRLQSALTDDHSVVIGYDKKRGEPRGKGESAGACVDCRRCVQVCPTGIDIRNGLQLECIGCAACVDACDEIMTKLHRPTGLVRYDSHTGLHGGKTRYIRPRTLFYTFMLLAGITAFFVASRSLSPMSASLVRMQGASYFVQDGVVRNQFTIRVINKRNREGTFRITLDGQLPADIQVSGNEQVLTLAPMQENQRTLIISVPVKSFHDGILFKARITDTETNESVLTRGIELLGPDPRLQNHAPLNPKDYLQ
jgi:cytochrome c oxidase accessory protein FixG